MTLLQSLGLNLTTFELKIGKLVSQAVANNHINLSFSMIIFVSKLGKCMDG